MTEPEKKTRLGAQLLRQDESMNNSTYEEYRMQLEESLTRAERREKQAGVVAVVSFVIALVLMFVGGTQVAGAFDPWDEDANALSITLGVVYAVASVLFWLALAAYFSRFRPRVRQARDDLRDAHIVKLQHEVAELRREVAAISGRDTQM